MGVRHDPNMRYELALSNPKEFYHEVTYRSTLTLDILFTLNLPRCTDRVIS